MAFEFKPFLSNALRHRSMVVVLFYLYLFRWILGRISAKAHPKDLDLRELHNLFSQNKNLYCLAPGASLQELTSPQRDALVLQQTWSTSMAFDSCPFAQVIFWEVSLVNARLREDFEGFVSLLQKHRRQIHEINALILIGLSADEATMKDLILTELPQNLQQRARFTSTFSFPSAEPDLIEKFLTLCRSHKYLMRTFNALLFCRSSASIPLLYAFLYNQSLDLYLVGMDGTGGAISDTYAGSEAALSMVHEKNTISSLHSTNNPEFGLPTVAQLLVLLSKHLTIRVSSTTSVYSTVLSLDRTIGLK